MCLQDLTHHVCQFNPVQLFPNYPFLPEIGKENQEGQMDSR